MKWNDLIRKQKEERKALIFDQIEKGHSQSEAARILGMHRQQIYQFCKIHNINFIGEQQKFRKGKKKKRA
mgnify:FL=1|tara:strand:+ start:11 stop:220 length:210 start_codon:yes stop_codon:yes gene_type:complete